MTASGPLHQATAHQPTQPSSSREKEKANRKLSLRWLLIVPFVLQIFAAVGLTGYLSFRNGQQAINELATRLRSEVSLRIDQHLETQLDTARNLAQTNGDAIDLKLLDRYIRLTQSYPMLELVTNAFFEKDFDTYFLLHSGGVGTHQSTGTHHLTGGYVLTYN